MSDNLKIDLGFAVLSASKSTAVKDIIIALETHNGVFIQDLVVVGQTVQDDEFEPVYEDTLSVKVYADQYSEDFTHEFMVTPYEE